MTKPMPKAKADIRCHLSDTGHNNFWYPSRSKIAILRSGAVVHPLPWISMDGMSAFLANAKDVITECKFSNKNTVIWAKKDSILFVV